MPTTEKIYTGWSGDVFPPKLPIIDVNYKEGVFVGYRWYESKKIEPLYPFGFGLSYTDFQFDNLKASSNNLKNKEDLSITFQLTNTGKRKGAEVCQLYVQGVNSEIERPVKELKAFSKIELAAKQSATVTMNLKYQDFAYWDEQKHDWVVKPGVYNLLLGSASDAIKKQVQITVE